MPRPPRTAGPTLAAAVLALGIVAFACEPATPDPGSPGSATPQPTPSGTPAAGVTASPTPPATPLPTPAAPTPAPTRPVPALRLESVVAGLDSPVDVTSAGDGSGRLFVVEQPGRIRVVRDGRLVAAPFLDIRDRIAAGGERGLLGLAFHPDYPTDPRLFVDYTDRDGDTVVSSFETIAGRPDRADPATERVLLRIDQPFGNHNGGSIVFGPDGMLYIGTGDGGSAGDPQGNGRRLDTLLAKILRIDVGGPDAPTPYTIPPDNPFVDRPAARPEIWLTGLRNPWRIRFDRATGDLWIGDVGQGAREEIDVARAGVGGLDFGWNTTEGHLCYKPRSGCDATGITLPVFDYSHDHGCAVIGGVVVRDLGQPALDGWYVASDSCSGILWVLDPVTDADGQSPGAIAGRSHVGISAINEAEDGSVWATSNDEGRLYRVVAD